MWVVFWLTALSGTIYLITTGIKDFYKYEVNTKSRIIMDRPSVFPKVTICNLDPFVTDESVTFLADIIKENVTYWDVDLTKTDLQIVNKVLAYNEIWFIKTAMFRAANSSTRNILGYSLHDLIRSCNFGPTKTILRQTSK